MASSKDFQGYSKNSSTTLELNLDLHTRLCKKIAQLTKVHINYLFELKSVQCSKRVDCNLNSFN